MRSITKAACFVFIVFISFLSIKAKAQGTPLHTFSLGIGPESGFSGVHNTGQFEFGGNVHLQYELTHKFSISLTSGYYTFSYIHLDDAPGINYTGPYGSDYNFQMIPVKAGLKYYFVARAYCDLEAGVGFANRLESGTKFLVSPGAGYAFKRWDLGFRYESFSGPGTNAGILAINFNYKFNFERKP